MSYKSNFSCVNCQIVFSQEIYYKQHYKSDHHRYNIKRKLISLPPISYNDYQTQFEHDITSKASTIKDLHCNICSKKFLSSQTYKQHINSKKHQRNHKKTLINSKCNRSQVSSNSEFSVINNGKKQECIFCEKTLSRQHLKDQHNFPPFESQCIDRQGLIQKIRETSKAGKCINCELIFQQQISVKQHMNDVGHNMLNLNNFRPFERFYLWSIQEISSEQEVQFLEDKQEEVQNFENINKTTLQGIQIKRLNRIKPTSIGLLINGKQVGLKHLKNYYKQYLDRQIPKNPWRQSLTIKNQAVNGNWKQKEFKRLDVPSIVNKMNYR